MLRNLATLTVTLSALATLTGCSEPIIGDWEASNACGKQELTVKDDGKGDGFFYDGNCGRCEFDFDWEEDGDDYQADVTLSTCNCGGVTNGKADCKMNDDGDEMACTLNVGACDMGVQDWEKVE